MATTTSSVPDGIYFELSPSIVLSVRVVNIVALLMVVVTFILCLIRGEDNSSNYLLAGNTIISALVGIVVNYWYKSGDLGSEKFWYIILVAVVLLFQCVTCDIFIFQVTKEVVVSPTLGPVNASTHVYSWAPFRTTPNKTLHLPHTASPLSFN